MGAADPLPLSNLWSPRAVRISAIAGFVAVALVLACGIIGPQIVAGPRVSGTENVATIRAYYSHSALASLQAGILPAAAAILVLAGGLHAVASGSARQTANLGLAFTAAIVPGYLLAASLQAALVTTANSGGDVLPLFRLWDVFYNSALYTLEAAYVLSFSIALTQSKAFPRWFAIFGWIVGLLQALNTMALWIGVPDAGTVPGNVGMLAWLLTASILLLRTTRTATRMRAA